MRRIALLSLTILSGCGYNTWWNPPFSEGTNPNLPVSDSENMTRVMGGAAATTPLTTEPGNIWPGALPPPRSLQELEKSAPTAFKPAAPAKGSPMDRASNPLLAPLPNGMNAEPPAPGQSPPASGADRRIIVPNGNGTSTVIYPDGRIETIPTPK
jgi:hypothetical protein